MTNATIVHIYHNHTRTTVPLYRVAAGFAAAAAVAVVVAAAVAAVVVVVPFHASRYLSA